MLDFYDGLKSWMEAQKAFIEQHEYAESLFGRRFHITKNRTVRSVFNAIVQGSVAHAMQMVIARLYESMGDYVLTEIHDSVILACEQDRATEIVNRAVDIMSHPLQGAIEEDPVFPLRVSVGLDWRRWQPYKVYR
jgi:DNA polymerase I-like protein with 3'-5' exonuclease and polymerase domains